MTRVWQTVVWAAAVNLAAAAVSTAQTVSVAKAPPGSTVEVSLNAANVGSATVDSSGVATVDVNLASRGGKEQVDVHVAVESCGNVLRIQLAESGAQPPPTPECGHTDIVGVYVMRRNTSIVVDVSPSTPVVWLRQGPAPQSWLHPEVAAEAGEVRDWLLPTGLVGSAAAGLGSFSDATKVACGDVSSCSSTGRLTLHAGGTFWLTRSFGVDVSVVKPADVITTGNGTGYRFTTTLQTSLATITGKIGFPAGPVRVYGMGGAAYHWAASSTSQTNDASSVTVDGVTTTIPGGTHISGVNAPSWGWVAGGGLEVWLKPWLAFYAEGAFAPLKGADTRGGEGRIDDHLYYGVGGVRIHIWH